LEINNSFNKIITLIKPLKKTRYKKMKYYYKVDYRIVPFPAWAKVSHMLGFLPSSFAAPSTFHITPFPLYI